MLNFFNKKSEEKEEKKIDSKKETLLSKEQKVETKQEKKEEQPTSLKKDQNLNKKHDKITEQCIEMGIDMKNEVEKFSRAFFNSKNKIKKDSYLKFESFLDSLSYEKKNELQNLKYLEFKEKEEQIFTILKNGFAQFLSKGSNLDEKTRQAIDFVFGDIKKMPSRGHRYWYYKIYIWQKRKED